MEVLENNGMTFSGINEKANLVEIVELKNHKCFIASQFHPEFKSRPTRPHPLFDLLVAKSLK
jgi:CTP synthase